MPMATRVAESKYQPRSQTVQAVRVEAGNDPDGGLVGAELCGHGVEQLLTEAKMGKFQGRVLVVHPVYGHSGLVGFGAEQGPDVRLPCPHGLGSFQRTGTAHDAQPHAALVVFAGQDLDLAHLPGGAGVGAAAGAHIGTGNGHDAHLPFDLLFAAVGQGGQLLRGGVGDDHRHVLPDDAVGFQLGGAQALGRDGHAGVHAHGLGPDVEAHILGPEHPVQDAGKDVLAGVLLHFVKAPVPVDGFLYRDARHGGVGQGRNAVPEDAVLFVDIGHGQLGAVRQGQGATVGRLTAAFRVEHRTFQRDESGTAASRTLSARVRKASASKYFSVHCMVRKTS